MGPSFRRWRRIVHCAAASLLAASCTNDSTGVRPLSATRASLALRASVATADQSTQVLIGAFYSTSGTPVITGGPSGFESALADIEPNILGGQIVDLTSSTTQQISLSVDLRACLAQSAQNGACPAYVVVALLRGQNTLNLDNPDDSNIDENNLLDIQIMGPVLLTPGSVGTVSQPVTLREVQQIGITPSRPSIAIGTTVKLTASAQNAYGEAVTGRQIVWAGLTNSVATVDQNGTVTGVAAGTAVISASAGGQTALDTVIVTGTLGRILGEVRDGSTFAVIAGATVQLSGAGITPRTTTTDAAGQYSLLNVAPGTYVVTISASGHVTQSSPTVAVANASGGDVVRVDAGLAPTTSAQPFGSVSGRVRDAAGQPLAGASVSISGGTQTNGVFRSTTSRADGTYGLPGIVLVDASGAPLTNFSLIVTSGASAPAIKSLSLATNRALSNVDVTIGSSSSGQLLFSETFESVTAWTPTGFWNRSTLTGIKNTAYPTYVSLAPDDASGGALPAPSQGSFAYWYGRQATGNFIGTQVTGDPPKSGGTSTGPNTGDLVSPAFTIPQSASQLLLAFDTWFEIESVDPNQDGYDIMTVYLRDAATGQDYLIRRLNPFVNPTIPGPAVPFTSGGFNVAPVWRPDLTVFSTPTALLGHSVRLVFRFDTVDEEYNGFRGWIVDNLRLSSGGLTPNPVLLVPPPQSTTHAVRARRHP